MRKLTVKDLLKQKDKKKVKTAELYIEELDGTITIEPPSRSLMVDALELGQDENYEGNGDEFLVYNITKEPNLKDTELQKAYDCVEPIDIVTKIFSIGTIAGIAEKAMELAGYDDKVTLVDDLKN